MEHVFLNLQEGVFNYTIKSWVHLIPKTMFANPHFNIFNHHTLLSKNVAMTPITTMVLLNFALLVPIYVKRGPDIPPKIK